MQNNFMWRTTLNDGGSTVCMGCGFTFHRCRDGKTYSTVSPLECETCSKYRGQDKKETMGRTLQDLRLDELTRRLAAVEAKVAKLDGNTPSKTAAVTPSSTQSQQQRQQASEDVGHPYQLDMTDFMIIGTGVAGIAAIYYLSKKVFSM